MEGARGANGMMGGGGGTITGTCGMRGRGTIKWLGGGCSGCLAFPGKITLGAALAGLEGFNQAPPLEPLFAEGPPLEPLEAWATWGLLGWALAALATASLGWALAALALVAAGLGSALASLGLGLSALGLIPRAAGAAL